MVGKRNANNARAYNAVWLDIDAKGPQIFEQGDNTNILATLRGFLAEVGLPDPSLTVNSGGGFHCYFVFPNPICKEQWSKIAHFFALD